MASRKDECIWKAAALAGKEPEIQLQHGLMPEGLGFE
jgi:hypothetical protein